MAARLQRVQSATIRIIAHRWTVLNFVLPGFGQKSKVGSLAKSALQERQVQPRVQTATSCANPATLGFGRHQAQQHAQPALLDPFPSLVGLKCAPSVQ